MFCQQHSFVLYREVHIRWCPEVSKAVESAEKLQCSDLIIAVGPNAAGKFPFSPFFFAQSINHTSRLVAVVDVKFKSILLISYHN